MNRNEIGVTSWRKFQLIWASPILVIGVYIRLINCNHLFLYLRWQYYNVSLLWLLLKAQETKNTLEIGIGIYAAQKMKFSIKDFLCFLHLLKKSLSGNFIFRAVLPPPFTSVFGSILNITSQLTTIFKAHLSINSIDTENQICE